MHRNFKIGNDDHLIAERNRDAARDVPQQRVNIVQPRSAAGQGYGESRVYRLALPRHTHTEVV